MILTISPSSIESLQNCPQQYYYSSIKRLRLIEEDTSRLDRGTLFHKMLALHYTLLISGIKDPTTKLEYLQIMNAVREAARELARNDEFPIEMVEECIEHYSDYAIYYQNDGWIPKESEVPFSKELFSSEELSIILEGRIDLIVETSDGQRFPVDHKTESKKDITELLNNQFMAYCWALGSNNFVKNAIGFQKTYDAPKRLHRETLSYDQAILDEWRENVILDVMQLANYIEKDYFPRRYAACKYCRYSKICGTSPDAREWKIKTLYKVGEGYDIFGKENK